MKEHKTFPGKVYAVTCSVDCTLTDENGMKETVEAGKQFLFMAQSAKVYTSEPATVTKGNFKYAPAEMLGLLGGGESASAQPSGYLAAEFLETESSAEIMLPLVFDVNVHGGLTIEQEHMSVVSQATSSAGWADEGYGGINTGLLNGSMACSRNGMGVGTSFVVPANEWFVHKWWFDGKSADIICYAPDGRSYKTSRTRAGCTAYTLWANRWKGKKRWFRAMLDDVAVFDLIPALSPQGEPCMFNKYDNTVYKNTAGKAAFVVGMTLAQSRKLGKLPKTGGSLTISLPSSIVSGNTVTDATVDAAIQTAKANGWQITVRTYTADATAASTFGLRRIWVRKTQDENGSYIDADGVRYTVDWCATMYTPDDSEPDAHGYEMFRSVDAAVDYWKLEPYVDPEAENLLTE